MKYTIAFLIAIIITAMSTPVLAYTQPKHVSVEPLPEIETPVQAPVPAPVQAPATDALSKSVSFDVATSSDVIASSTVVSKPAASVVSTTTAALMAAYRKQSIIASNCFQNAYDAIAYGFLRGASAVNAYAKCWAIVPVMPTTTDAF